MNARHERGFSGLITLVSDVSADIADAGRLVTSPQPMHAPPQASSTPAAPPVIRAPLGGMSVGVKWALGLGIVVAIIWFIGLFGEGQSPPRVETPSAPAPPVTAAAPTPSAPREPTPRLPAASSPSEAIPSASSAPREPTPHSSSALDLYGSKPPVGTGLLLDSTQVRHC